MVTHKPVSVPKNETNKILVDSNIQMDNLFKDRRPDQMLNNKKNIIYILQDFPLRADHMVKILKKNKQVNECLELTREP